MLLASLASELCRRVRAVALLVVLEERDDRRPRLPKSVDGVARARAAAAQRLEAHGGPHALGGRAVARSSCVRVPPAAQTAPLLAHQTWRKLEI